MQDSTFDASNPNNDKLKETIDNSATLPDAAIISKFEESLRVRLEAYALDAQELLSFSSSKDIATLKEQFDLQQNQLEHLINDISLLHWLTQKSKAQVA